MTRVPSTARSGAFPLGGIGTGNVSLGPRGELCDWELENLPDKGRHNPYSGFAIHAAPADAPAVTRLLEARLQPPHEFDVGYASDRLGGLPRLAAATLDGEYPIARIAFDDDVLPVEVELTAFTPLVPLDADDSGIPAAVLRYAVRNPGAAAVTVTIAGTVSHVAGRGPDGWVQTRQTAGWREGDGIRGIDFGVELPADDPGYGTLSLATTAAADVVSAKPCWAVSMWPDGPQLYWDDLRADGRLEPEDDPIRTEQSDLFWAEHPDGDPLEALPRLRTGSLAITHELAPGESRDFEFLLAWSFPNRRRGWHGHIIRQDPHGDEIAGNAYGTRFADAWAAAAHLADQLPRLERATRDYVDALYHGSLDPAIADAVGANVSAVRSTTCFRLADGTFAAWEGSFAHAGSCEGTCTHVWNYAQTVAWLFPELERSARRIEFLLETDADGAQKFRTNRLFGGPAWVMGPAVDGQLGTLVRLHREWRFSGDDALLAECWPAAVRAIEYALREWDRDGDGLLDGSLHNTYDIEFVGIDPLANSYLLAALRACAAMAAHRGATEPDDRERAARWSAAADRAATAMDATLFTGEHYRQVIDDVDASRYQYGDGVLSDQLLGQFHAHLNGLGHLLPADHVRSALSAVVRHNFRDDLSTHESTQRTYALNDEAGLLLASWPDGGRPRIPFIYSDEVWTGIEYQVATTLLYEGLVDEALRIVRAVRARHTGAARSPWNESECGNHYARSMASWGLLLAATGAQYDAPTRALGFDPVTPTLDALFTTGTGWGRVVLDADALTLSLAGGSLAVDRVTLRGDDLVDDDGRSGAALTAGDRIRFPIPA